jgi:hypothetical protein
VCPLAQPHTESPGEEGKERKEGRKERKERKKEKREKEKKKKESEREKKLTQSKACPCWDDMIEK